MKKLLSLLVMFCMMITLIAPSQAEAVSLKLSKSKATLEVDATLKLKLGTLSGADSKWTTSDKTIATVSKWGVITAKKEGAATITATYDNVEYTCTVKVVNSNKKVNSYEFNAGVYIVGDDIPAGKYDIECVDGKDFFYLYDNEDDCYNDTHTKFYQVFAMNGKEDYTNATKTYKNLKLTNGQAFKIESDLVIKLTSK